jgi:hypothetical protein
MIGVGEAVAVVVLIFFVCGVIVAVLVLSAWAIWREDRRGTLTGRAPDRLSSGVRRLMGLGLQNVETEPERLAEKFVRQ